jgi:hypothetical protein
MTVAGTKGKDILATSTENRIKVVYFPYNYITYVKFTFTLLHNALYLLMPKHVVALVNK